MKRKVSLAIVLVFLASIMFVNVAAAQVIIYEDNFDSYNEGDLPNNMNHGTWQGHKPADEIAPRPTISFFEVRQVAGKTGKGLYWENITAGDQENIQLDFPDTGNANFAIEFDYMRVNNDNPDGQTRFIPVFTSDPIYPYMWGVQTVVQRNTFINARDIATGEWEDAVGGTNLIEIGKWYNFRLEFDQKNLQYHFYIDGVKITTKRTNGISVNAFRFSTPKNHLYTKYIDNFKVINLDATPAPVASATPAATATTTVATPAPAAPSTGDNVLLTILPLVLALIAGSFVVLRVRNNKLNQN